MLLRTLKRLGEHWVGDNLKLIRKSLVTLPMGISIPPFIKVIMGITTASGGLFITSHSLNSQCWSSTSSRILYLVLKAAIPSGVSTNLANLPMCSYKVKINREERKKSFLYSMGWGAKGICERWKKISSYCCFNAKLYMRNHYMF